MYRVQAMARRDDSTPQRRVNEVWSWLPAFRAVAEREHVHGASRELHVTASSLSRSIHLVEAAVGKKLFLRVGRNVRLTNEGHELLAAVRDGMRLIDDGLARATTSELVGVVRVACEGDQPLAMVSRAALRLTAKHRALTVVVEELGAPSELAPRILRGDLDLAIVTRAPTIARLRVDDLGAVRYGVYCGAKHPLFRARAPGRAAILAHPFVAPTPRAGEEPGDHWPPSIHRTVALLLPALQPAIAVCASGTLLAVLPDSAVEAAAERRELRRLPLEIIPPSPLLAVRRDPLGSIDRGSAFVAELEADVAAAPRAARAKANARPRSLSRQTNRGRG